MVYLIFAGGFIMGLVISSILYHVRSASGTLRIDRTNPQKDVYRIDIDDLDSLSKKKRALLKVDSNANLSQK